MSTEALRVATHSITVVFRVSGSRVFSTAGPHFSDPCKSYRKHPKMFQKREKKGTQTLVAFLLLKTFLLVEAAPNLNLKSWNEGDIPSIISAPCATNEPYCNWLPVIDAPDSYILQGNPEMQAGRIQTIRGANSGLIPWRGTPGKIETIERISIPVSSSFPSRLSKKDVFMSRGWGAGGMPFSVLYMSPHNSRTNHGVAPGSNPEESSKSETSIRTSEMIPLPSKNTQENYRVALRNGPSGQPRRQYSIIPQLFISYGWGSSVK